MEEFVNIQEFVKDLVSIIVPVYNSEKYLSRCIESIINQSYENTEIILIDDGSTDNSGQICKEYSQNNSKIKVMHTSNNGPAIARNVGIKNSKGSFLIFVDSDDFLQNNAIELLMENYSRYKADIIAGDFNKIRISKIDYAHHVSFLDSRLLTKQDILDHTRYFLKKPSSNPLFTYIWGKLFKSPIIKMNNIFFNTDLPAYEDL